MTQRELLFIYKIISIFEIMVTQKEGKWWLVTNISGLIPACLLNTMKALGAASWISFAALLIRRCLQSGRSSCAKNHSSEVLQEKIFLGLGSSRGTTCLKMLELNVSKTDTLLSLAISVLSRAAMWLC